MSSSAKRIWPGATGFWVIGPKLLGPFATEAAAVQQDGGES